MRNPVGAESMQLGIDEAQHQGIREETNEEEEETHGSEAVSFHGAVEDHGSDVESANGAAEDPHRVPAVPELGPAANKFSPRPVLFAFPHFPFGAPLHPGLSGDVLPESFREAIIVCTCMCCMCLE